MGLKFLIVTPNQLEDARIPFEQYRNQLQGQLQLFPAKVQQLPCFELCEIEKLVPRMQSRDFDILHFIGHGSNFGQRFFPDSKEIKKIEDDNLYEILSATLGAHSLKLIFFQSCFSDKLAKKCTEFADVAIGMDDQVNGYSSIVYATLFYNGIFSNEAITAAHNASRFALSQEEDECETPVIFVKAGVNRDTHRIGESYKEWFFRHSCDRLRAPSTWIFFLLAAIVTIVVVAGPIIERQLVVSKMESKEFEPVVMVVHPTNERRDFDIRFSPPEQTKVLEVTYVYWRVTTEDGDFDPPLVTGTVKLDGSCPEFNLRGKSLPNVKWGARKTVRDSLKLKLQIGIPNGENGVAWIPPVIIPISKE